MAELAYCRRCVTPTSHPMIRFGDDGVCKACVAYDRQERVDWARRKPLFDEIVADAKARSSGYDCLVPVSGGKDSFWQVITCLDYGMNPLCVTWKDPARLEIGRENLEALIQLGVDHIDYQVNPKVERRFLYQSLVEYGVTGIPKHMALYNIPLKLAIQFNIPLIVWGENDAIEYGNDSGDEAGFRVDYRWLMKHGITQGTSAADWVKKGFTSREMTPYFGPSEAELDRQDIRAVYLGYYFRWDPVKSYQLARARGFRAPATGPGYYEFDDVDSGFITIHHFIKWYKFGYTRLFDNLSHEVRRGRVSRQQAVQIIAERAPETPHEDIDSFCTYLGIAREEFFRILERFRNPKVWSRRDGRWVIEDFIVPDFDRWDQVLPDTAAA